MSGNKMPRRLPRYCIEDVDRYGKVRVYLRVKGRPKVKLDGIPWTPDFMARYEAALKGHTKPHSGVQPQTWEWLCRLYFTSKRFTEGLTENTQRVRRRILVRTFEEPLRPGASETFGQMPVREMTPKAIRVLRDRLSATPEMANGRLKAIRQVFIFGIEEERALANPAREVGYIRSESEGFYTWTREDVFKFLERWPVGTKPHLAMSLMLYLGVRRSDAAILGRQHVRERHIVFKPIKRARGKPPKTLSLPILPALKQCLDAGPTGDLTFLVTEFGKPFTANGFGNWFKGRCRMAGLPQCSAHGLRKAGATFAAENGATDAQLMAMFGWSNPKMAAHYRKAAEQKRLADAAMGLVSVQLSDPVGHFGENVG